MSTILSTYNIHSQEWTVNETDLAGHYFDLQIGFVGNNPTVEFDDVSMGFKLSQDLTVIQEFQYPPEDTVIHSTDQPYIVNYRLHIDYSQTYSLKIWAKNAGVLSETEYQFETPAAPDFEAMYLATHQYEVT